MTTTKMMTLIVASAALIAAAGVPAWSAMHSAAEGDTQASLTSLFGGDQTARPMLLAESDDHDDEDEGTSATHRVSDDDEQSCEEDEGSCSATARAPAPAGGVAPPQNGLLGTTPPQVQVK
ncbi:hypothetical protein [Aestuariivirga sp.]|uniref:hypothetical protein n=1 Tax=Aestuariivirga sp. TaxID=2650926 RepID=UPI003BAD3DAD